jgi:hypothetical protein
VTEPAQSSVPPRTPEHVLALEAALDQSPTNPRLAQILAQQHLALAEVRMQEHAESALVEAHFGRARMHAEAALCVDPSDLRAQALVREVAWHQNDLERAFHADLPVDSDAAARPQPDVASSSVRLPVTTRLSQSLERWIRAQPLDRRVFMRRLLVLVPALITALLYLVVLTIHR